MPPRITLGISNESDRVRLSRTGMAWLRKHVRLVLPQAGVRKGEIAVRLIDDEEMARLHEQYTGKQGTTDILTFNLLENANEAVGRDGIEVQADIVISLPVAAAQAAGRGYGVERELLLYVIHGILHCTGYDDHTKAGYRRMHAREDAILEAIGVGATFQPPVPKR